MRITLIDVKNSRIPAALGICATDARLIAWLNEAVERLLYEGKYFGTYAKFRICSTDNCITLPRQIATIEVAAVCGRWIPVHDLWFEFLESGAGTRGGQGQCGLNEADYRGAFPTFSDLIGTNKKLRWLCDVSDDIGKEALFLGYDQNGNWIRTVQNGALADGEVIAASQSPGTLSSNFFSSVTDIQFPSDMAGQHWLYEYNNDTTVLRLIGHYQYDETRPSYARYFIPSLASCGQTVSDGTCNSRMVEIIGKLAFIPVQVDTDYVIFGNIPALKEMMVALKYAENEMDSLRKNAIVASGLAVAKSILDKELSHYLGDGREVGITMMGSSVGHIDPVYNPL